MDLLPLGREDFVPEKIVEGYNSLIWTERYRDPGEFELKTHEVDKTAELLPEGKFVTHRETDEVMMVETHTIAPDADGLDELTIKGRSLDIFLDNRALEGRVGDKRYKLNIMFTHSEMAGLLIWNSVVNPTNRDVTDHPIRNNSRDILDTLPGVVVSDSSTFNHAKKRRWVRGGSIYPQIITILRQGKLGLRTVRPPSAARILRVDEETETLVVYNQNNNTPNLRFDIYNGVDRRRQQSTNDPVIFHYAGDYMEDESYLRSIAEYDTMVLMVPGRYDPRKYYRDRPNDKDLSGWDRRVLWLNGGEPDLEEIPDQPDDPTAAELQAWREQRNAIRARNAATHQEFREDLRDLAESELEKHDKIRAFECKITAASPYKYNIHYGLGDKVTLVGRYDNEKTMQVAEYVRTEDKTGDVGYPGLVDIGEL